MTSTGEGESEVVATKVVKRKPGDYLGQCFPEKYDEQFAKKQGTLRELLQWEGPIEAFASTTEHFRMRANFQMWHDVPQKKTPQGFYYCMFDPEDSKHIAREITTFPRGTKRINELMPLMMEICQSNDIIFQELFEIRFVTTKVNNEAIVVLCYKRPLHPQWLAEAEKIAQQHNLKIIGRARKMKQVTGLAGGATSSDDPDNVNDEYIVEKLEVLGHEYKYFQTEGAFSQPNAFVCEKMLTWACNMTKDSQDHDLLELYCGGGTFTAPLATNFRKVLATEISKASVDLARRCFVENNINNITVVRLSSEEFTEWYTGKKDFGRTKEQRLHPTQFHIDTVFVDPPRAGLDEGTCRLISKFNKIVYVSCNPVTLARDVKMLSETHDVTHVAAFDQFPYTHHLESGVVLVRKPSTSTTQETTEAVVVEEEKEENVAKKARIEE